MPDLLVIFLRPGRHEPRVISEDGETPYWFPSQTTGGSIREDRLVLPIPPGARWSEVKGTVLPTEQKENHEVTKGTKQKSLPSRSSRLRRDPKTKPARPVLGAALWFAPPEPVPAPKPVKEPKPKREKRKNDSKLIAAAQELRDRWLEQVNAPDGASLILPRGKYDVTRAIETVPMKPMPAIAA